MLFSWESKHEAKVAEMERRVDALEREVEELQRGMKMHVVPNLDLLDTLPVRTFRPPCHITTVTIREVLQCVLSHLGLRVGVKEATRQRIYIEPVKGQRIYIEPVKAEAPRKEPPHA